MFLVSTTEFHSLGFNNERDGSFYTPNPETLEEFRAELAKALQQKVATILIAGMQRLYHRTLISRHLLATYSRLHL